MGLGTLAPLFACLVIAAPNENHNGYGFDTPPTPVKTVEATYSEVPRIAGLEGTVHVEVTIGTDGRVIAARVIRTAFKDVRTQSEALAMEAARKWEFYPAMVEGVPCFQAVVVPISVSLGETGLPEGTLMESIPDPEIKADFSSATCADTASVYLKKAYWPSKGALEKVIEYDGQELRVGVLVGDHGRVVDSWIVRGRHGWDSLRNAATHAAMNWEFRPARLGGKPVQSKIILPFEFKLD